MTSSSGKVKSGSTARGSQKALNPEGTGNYDAQCVSFNRANISSGKIHQDGVTKAFCVNTPDALHTFYMDMDGERKGWTTFQGPGNFQINHGSDNTVDQETIWIHAEKGNITIKATDGIITLAVSYTHLRAHET